MSAFVQFMSRKRFWIPLTLFAAYALFGFLVLPGILRTQILKGVRDGMKREVKLDRVRFNPLILSLTLEGFELRDPDGTPFVGFDRLYVDVQVSSVVRWALTLREFRLDRPRIHVRLMPDGKLNFADLLPTESGPTPRVVVGRFAVNQGSLRVGNLMAARPEEGVLTPIDLLLENFTTIPQKEGHYRIAAKDQGQGSWEWTGDLRFEPLHSSGVFEVRDSRLRAFAEILRNRTGIEVTDGRVGCRLQYAVDVRGDSLVARVEDSSLRLHDFALREPRGSEDLLRLDTLAVTGVGLAYPEQTASIGRVLLSGADVRAWRNADSTLNWQALLTPPPGAAPSAPAASSGTTRGPAPAGRAPGTARTDSGASPPDWRVRLDELAIRDLGLRFADRTLDPPFELAVAPVNVTLRGISNEPGARFALQSDVTIAAKGRLELSGSVGALPPAADLEVNLSNLPLPIFQPYLDPLARLQLASGSLGVQGSVRFRDARPVPDVAFRGRVESRGLLTRDRRDNERFLAWNAVEVSGIEASPTRVEIGAVRLTQPFAKVVIRRDRTTNIQEILGLPMPDSAAAPVAAPPRQGKRRGAASKPAAPKPSEALAAMQRSPEPPLPVRVGRIEVVNGSADFADLSLILPFAARIEQLSGHVSQLSSRGSTRSDVKLDGRLQPSGTVRVGGGVAPWSRDTLLDLRVVFQDFSMPALTPYAGQFLGREIDKGRMSLDLGYRLTGRQLTGENKVVLDELELGEKVESPEATKLPVGLAIAILKDKEGRIDLDVPVEGDLDDPEFRLGKVIWNFILNLLKKIATAPFALLGGLFGGGGGEELGHVSFEPGSSVLAEDRVESLDKLAKALAERPKLNLEIRGSTDAALDGAAIRAAKFAALAAERMAADPKRYGTTIGYSQRLLEDLYAARFGKEALTTLRESHTTTAGALPERDPLFKAGSNRRVVNVPAMSTAIQDTLTAVQGADAAELLALANARALAVKARLLAQGIEEARVFLLDPAPGEVVDGRVRMELMLSD